MSETAVNASAPRTSAAAETPATMNLRPDFLVGFWRSGSSAVGAGMVL